MDNYIKKHVDELYATGKTTFRDVDGEYEDGVIEFVDLVASCILYGGQTIAKFFMEENSIMIFITLRVHINYEIKQLCIDYYEDE